MKTKLGAASRLKASQTHTFQSITYNQSTGKGSVPYNVEIDYKGKEVLMKTSTFLSLCPPIRKGQAETQNFEFLKAWVAEGNAIGSPFLKIDIPKVDGVFTAKGAQVCGHEGRNRALAVQELFGDVHLLVHIIPTTMDGNKKLTPELMGALCDGIISETGKHIRGPIWK